MVAMGKSTTVEGDDRRFSISTNWTIAAGSLSSAISIESTDTPIEEEEDDDSHAIKTPLVLTPSSSLSEPCHIRINFAQKQEVQQVYVRSTARVYEIYSAHSVVSNDEYLCTVRCGVATRDDKVLHASDVEPARSNSKDLSREGEKVSCSSSEEDWVDLKVIDMPFKDERLNAECENFGPNRLANLEDLYEATAEFTDSDGCTSLMLRLLSLQTKDSINIDEIYIFFEPGDSASSEAQAAPLGNSTTSLMSMLVPTLLQLSKSRSSQIQDVHAPKSSENGKYMDVGSKVNCSTDFGNKVEQDNIVALTKPPDMHIPEEELATGKINNFVAQTDVSTNRVECVLEQLVFRVSRIEDIFLRFEENMLNPIKSIEQRLQLVEEQVQVLVKNSQPSKIPSYTGIAAPDFSCGESNSSSFYNEINENLPFEEMELKKKDPIFSAKFHPGLVIRAPEFLCDDDEGNSDSDHMAKDCATGLKSDCALEKPMKAPEFLCHDDEENSDGDHMAKGCATGLKIDCALEKPTKALSIDDALAAALSGFMANTTVQPVHYTQALSVKAPEFTMENSDDDMAAKENENTLVPPTVSNDLCGTECKDSKVSSSSKFTMDENGDDGMATKQYENAVVSAIFYNESNGTKCKNGPPEENSNGQDNLATNCSKSEFELQFAQPDDSQILDPTSVREPSNEFSNSVSVKSDILNVVSVNPEFDLEKSSSENPISLDEIGESQRSDSRSVEEPSIDSPWTSCIVDSGKSTSKNSIDSPWTSCIVDFELPILDVKFTSSEFTSAASSLEELFDNVYELVAEDCSVDKKNGYEKIDHAQNSSSTYIKDLLDCDVNDASYRPSGLEGDALDDSLARDKQDNFPSLLFDFDCSR